MKALELKILGFLHHQLSHRSVSAVHVLPVCAQGHQKLAAPILPDGSVYLCHWSMLREVWVFPLILWSGNASGRGVFNNFVLLKNSKNTFFSMYCRGYHTFADKSVVHLWAGEASVTFLGWPGGNYVISSVISQANNKLQRWLGIIYIYIIYCMQWSPGQIYMVCELRWVHTNVAVPAVSPLQLYQVHQWSKRKMQRSDTPRCSWS